MNHIDIVPRDFLAECQDDYVGLWSVLKRLRRAMPPQSFLEERNTTLGLLKQLLEDGKIMVGDLSEAKGFQEWSLSPTEAIGRIADEWSKLGRDPTIGDIAWFTSRD
jgi:hypothetical protein